MPEHTDTNNRLYLHVVPRLQFTPHCATSWRSKEALLRMISYSLAGGLISDQRQGSIVTKYPQRIGHRANLLFAESIDDR